MSLDYFITDASTLSPRWRAAAPDGHICSSLDPLPESGDGQIRAWLLTGSTPDWQQRMAELAARQFLIIALTRNPTDAELQSCLRAGARAYLEAFANTSALTQVAQTVASGAVWLPAELVSGMLGSIDRRLSAHSEAQETRLQERLTSRECDVVQALRQGMTNKQIARTLGISERTVKEHLGTVFGKFGVTDRLQLVLRLNGRDGLRETR